MTAETRDALVSADVLTTPYCINIALTHTLNQSDSYLVDDRFPTPGKQPSKYGYRLSTQFGSFWKILRPTSGTTSGPTKTR
ncbi:hypothetical protein OH492_19055 [Vibrio chagasii]|nr:hypothetical protein [Vibrio chagasii]